MADGKYVDNHKQPEHQIMAARRQYDRYITGFQMFLTIKAWVYSYFIKIIFYIISRPGLQIYIYAHIIMCIYL